MPQDSGYWLREQVERHVAVALGKNYIINEFRAAFDSQSDIIAVCLALCKGGKQSVSHVGVGVQRHLQKTWACEFVLHWLKLGSITGGKRIFQTAGD